MYRYLEILVVRMLVKEPLEMREEIRRGQMLGSFDGKIQDLFRFEFSEDRDSRTAVAAACESSHGFPTDFAIRVGKTVE